MGSLMQEIKDDINEYLARCGRMNEKPQYTENGTVDCYGFHAKHLKRIEQNNFKN